MPLSSPPIPKVVEHLPRAALSPSIAAATPPSSSTTSIDKRHKRRRRQIDESCAVEPTDADVLFGRGSRINNHPGNVRFRQKALELRAWYERPDTTREEKYRISDLLVESIKREGRFLERGPDGRWHEVIGNGARKKASQALRENLKGARMVKRGDETGGIAGATASMLGAKGEAAMEEPIDHMQPADVASDMIGI